MQADSTNPTDEFATVVLDIVVKRMKMSSRLRMSYTAAATARVSSLAESYADELLYELTCYISGTTTPVVRKEFLTVNTQPDGKWQAIKEYFLPFLKSRFPVRYKTTEVMTEMVELHNHLCPHRELPAEDFAHLRFLSSKS